MGTEEVSARLVAHGGTDDPHPGLLQQPPVLHTEWTLGPDTVCVLEQPSSPPTVGGFHRYLVLK